MFKWAAVVVVLAGLVGIAILVGADFSLHPTPAPSGKLNVILISIDSLRTDHMSLYGYDRDTTPMIDAWAKGAVVFNNYYSTSFLTPISEASVHTGDYPMTSGVINFQTPLRDTIPTLAQLLQHDGWQTAAFGSSPEYSGYPAMKDTFSRGFDVYEPTQTASDEFNGRGNDPIAQAVSWMQGSTTPAHPFYLWLSIGSIHWPYGQNDPDHFTDPSYNGFLKTFPDAQWAPYGFMYNGEEYLLNHNTGDISPEQPVTPQDLQYVVDRYDDGILSTDAMLGVLFDYLKTSGLDKNTIVVIQSEHGEDFGERGYISHYDIYDEQVHTPLIIKAPGLAPARVSALASGVDVLPTILYALHLATSTPPIDGSSLWPFLTNATSTAPDTDVYISRTPLWERIIAYAYNYPQLQGFIQADDANHYFDTAIQNTQYELIHRRSRDADEKWNWWSKLTGQPITLPEYELYDITSDPQEKNNIYDAHKNDPVVVDLQQKLLAWEAQMEPRLPGPPPPQPAVQPYF